MGKKICRLPRTLTFPTYGIATHLTAGLSTPLTDLSALFHFFTANFGARFGARFTYSGTGFANIGVKR